ncbi:MAG: transcriptional regulator [Myxococcaceae bacterium]|nr:MAG: transcriptional regulator [Myxococcaceae bacterium]
MDVANRVSPYVAGYLEDVPAAGTLLLDIARRKLTGAQLARVRAFLDAEFPLREARGDEPVPALGALLCAERVVVQLSCEDYEDALDVVAGRLASALPGLDAAALAEGLRQREGEAPSQVGNGVAVPHAFVPGAAPVAALVTLARPLKTGAPDGQPLRLVVALVDGHLGRARLMRLAHVARLAGRGLADRLQGAGEAWQVLETLEELEALR